jgi:Methyltransferase domain
MRRRRMKSHRRPAGPLHSPRSRKDSAIFVSLANGETRPSSGEWREATSARSCPVCGGTELSTHRHNLSQCARCRHIYQTDLCVSTVYDADYAHRYDARPHRALSALRWKFIERSVRLMAGSRILDIGYGNGSFLKHARSCGMEVYGLDVHGEDFGITTVSRDTPLAFDLVCFFDSLEHIPKFAWLFALRAAHVIVSIPDAPDYLLETPRAWRHFKPGEHLHYFSRHSLDLLMRNWGLTTKLADGCPEDELRGKLSFGSRVHDNIYTAIYREGR